MNEMTKGHTAEEMQIAIENIVNEYDLFIMNMNISLPMVMKYSYYTISYM